MIQKFWGLSLLISNQILAKGETQQDTFGNFTGNYSPKVKGDIKKATSK